MSFETISSVGANAAIIHYKPDRESSAIIDPNKIYLCDSGAQYKDGTTDVTRTFHFKNPSDFEKRAFTRVLQGHIQLDLAVFPQGTTGFILDPLARIHLWRDGLDYRHGTGHGVGHFLNVHEGPHGIGLKKVYNDFPLKAGMTVTNEPGYYHDGAFGVRIENILIVKEAETPHQFSGQPSLAFEHVTMVPIGRNLLDLSLLSVDEKNWINRYHEKCWDLVSPHLKSDSVGYRWLWKETRPI